MVVEGWLARAAAKWPERTAIESTGRRCSYERLLLGAREGAGDLAGRDVRPGDRVAIALAPGLEFAQALHACLLLGAVAVPVDVRLGTAERELIAGGARVVLEEPLGGFIDGERAGDRENAPDLEHASEHDLDATAVVIHTSGTTSAPRPIELTYGNLLWSALGSAVALGVDPRERWLCALPVSHVGGLSILVRSTIYATTAVIHEHFDADRVLAALISEDVTLVSLVATTLARLLDAGLSDPPSLRCALTGGGPVPDALVERARAAGVPVSLTYGLTESCSQVTTTPVAAISTHRSAADRLPCPPLFCTRVRLEEDGEIAVAGPTVAPGARSRGGWLHTGDLGSLDDHLGLRVSGRKADTIVTGGENVSPQEVEAVLEEHPDVLEAAVIARADDRWGEAVTAIVVGRAGRDPDAEALRTHCAATLAPFKVPKLLVLRSEPLPRTRSGKLLRRELR